MILKIKQEETSKKNKYEITNNNGEVKFIAGTPWLEIQAPLDVDNIRKCILSDINDSVIFSTSYNVAENVLNSAIPLKWVFTGEQKNSIYRIYDKDSNEIGKFYKLINGLVDTKFIIDYNNSQFICYDKSVGKTRHLMLYKDEVQIAEIVKPLYVIDNKDSYYIYLLDEFNQFMDIFSFFVIFFDYNQYSNSGQAMKTSTIKWSYTWDKNNRFYNKHWIFQHFKKEDIDKINQEILDLRKESMKKIKNSAKFTLIFCGVLAIILAIVAGIVIFIN